MAEFLGHLRGNTADFADFIHEVNRQSDGLALVGQGAFDRLLDPPRSISAQLAALFRVETLHRFHQTDVALGNEVQEGKPVVAEVVGNLDHKAEIGRDHLFAGLFVAAFDLPGQLDLITSGQEGHLADLTQIETDIVVRSFHGIWWYWGLSVPNSDRRSKRSFNLICGRTECVGARFETGIGPQRSGRRSPSPPQPTGAPSPQKPSGKPPRPYIMTDRSKLVQISRGSRADWQCVAYGRPQSDGRAGAG